MNHEPKRSGMFFMAQGAFALAALIALTHAGSLAREFAGAFFSPAAFIADGAAATVTSGADTTSQESSHTTETVTNTNTAGKSAKDKCSGGCCKSDQAKVQKSGDQNALKQWTAKCAATKGTYIYTTPDGKQIECPKDGDAGNPQCSASALQSAVTGSSGGLQFKPDNSDISVPITQVSNSTPAALNQSTTDALTNYMQSHPDSLASFTNTANIQQQSVYAQIAAMASAPVPPNPADTPTEAQTGQTIAAKEIGGQPSVLTAVPSPASEVSQDSPLPPVSGDNTSFKDQSSLATLGMNGQPLNLPKDDARYQAIMDAYNSKDYQTVRDLTGSSYPIIVNRGDAGIAVIDGAKYGQSTGIGYVEGAGITDDRLNGTGPINGLVSYFDTPPQNLSEKISNMLETGSQSSLFTARNQDGQMLGSVVGGSIGSAARDQSMLTYLSENYFTLRSPMLETAQGSNVSITPIPFQDVQPPTLTTPIITPVEPAAPPPETPKPAEEPPTPLPAEQPVPPRDISLVLQNSPNAEKLPEPLPTPEETPVPKPEPAAAPEPTPAPTPEPAAEKPPESAAPEPKGSANSETPPAPHGGSATQPQGTSASGDSGSPPPAASNPSSASASPTPQSTPSYFQSPTTIASTPTPTQQANSSSAPVTTRTPTSLVPLPAPASATNEAAKTKDATQSETRATEGNRAIPFFSRTSPSPTKGPIFADISFSEPTKETQQPLPVSQEPPAGGESPQQPNTGKAEAPQSGGGTARSNAPAQAAPLPKAQQGNIAPTPSDVQKPADGQLPSSKTVTPSNAAAPSSAQPAAQSQSPTPDLLERFLSGLRDVATYIAQSIIPSAQAKEPGDTYVPQDPVCRGNPRCYTSITSYTLDQARALIGQPQKTELSSFSGSAGAYGPINQNAIGFSSTHLPGGTRVVVCNTLNNICVEGPIIDRGPSIKNRELDANPAATRALGLKDLAPVNYYVQAVPTNEQAVQIYNGRTTPTAGSSATWDPGAALATAKPVSAPTPAQPLGGQARNNYSINAPQSVAEKALADFQKQQPAVLFGPANANKDAKLMTPEEAAKLPEEERNKLTAYEPRSTPPNLFRGERMQDYPKIGDAYYQPAGTVPQYAQQKQQAARIAVENALRSQQLTSDPRTAPMRGDGGLVVKGDGTVRNVYKQNTDGSLGGKPVGTLQTISREQAMLRKAAQLQKTSVNLTEKAGAFYSERGNLVTLRPTTDPGAPPPCANLTKCNTGSKFDGGNHVVGADGSNVVKVPGVGNVVFKYDPRSTNPGSTRTNNSALVIHWFGNIGTVPNTIQCHLNGCRGNNVSVQFYVDREYTAPDGTPTIEVTQLGSPFDRTAHAMTTPAGGQPGPGIENRCQGTNGDCQSALRIAANAAIYDAYRTKFPGMGVVNHQGTEGLAIAQALQQRTGQITGTMSDTPVALFETMQDGTLKQLGQSMRGSDVSGVNGATTFTSVDESGKPDGKVNITLEDIPLGDVSVKPTVTPDGKLDFAYTYTPPPEPKTNTTPAGGYERGPYSSNNSSPFSSPSSMNSAGQGQQPSSPQSSQQPTQSTASTQCQNVPMPTTPCSGGSWRPITQQNSGQTCVTSWQCVPLTNQLQNAQITCSPRHAMLNQNISVIYACDPRTTAQGTGFAAQGSSGVATTSVTVMPTGTTTATFTLTCNPQTGSVTSSSASCGVDIVRAHIVLIANPSHVAYGKSSSVGWITSGMNACTIASPERLDFTQQNAEGINLTGTTNISAVRTQTHIVLTCTTISGTTMTAATTIEVQ